MIFLQKVSSSAHLVLLSVVGNMRYAKLKLTFPFEESKNALLLLKIRELLALQLHSGKKGQLTGLSLQIQNICS